MISRGSICLLALCIGLMQSACAQELPAGEIYTPLEQGLYRGSERVGVWNYFDHPSRVSLTIDYTKGEVLFLEEDTSTFVVLEGGKKVRRRLTRPCRFHGSYLPLFQHYRKSVQMPNTLTARASKSKEPLDVLLTFEVGEEGVAKNPIVLRDPGFGVKAAILRSFETAPNSWLPGVKEDGTPATCVLGLRFRVCLDSCQYKHSSEAKVVYELTTIVDSEPKNYDKSIHVAHVGQGIQYSPDNKKILVETPSLVDAVSYNLSQPPEGMIVDREIGSYKQVPFSNVNGCTWLDNERVYFNYSLDLIQNMSAIYSLSSGKVKTYSNDSLSFYNVISTDMTRMAYATALGKGSRILMKNIESGNSVTVFENRSSKFNPMGWSPQNDKLLIGGSEEGITQGFIIDLPTMNRTVVPLIEGSFCGWSHDQQFMYLVKFDGENLSGTIIAYDLKSHLLKEVYSKIRGLTLARFSSEARKFVFIMRGDAYIQSLDSAEPVKIADGIFNAVWNRTGTHICLVGSKDKQLYEYEVTSRKKKKLTNWAIK